MTNNVDVLVLREGTEGLSMASYAERLRERLPDHSIEYARTPAEERGIIPHGRIVTGISLNEELLALAD